MIIRPSRDPLPQGPDDKMQMDRVAVLSAGHFINDIYPGFVSPLLPLLMTKIGFGLPLAGLLISLMSLFNSFLQPVFGHIADKSRYPWLVVFGPLVTAVFMSMIGLVNSYEMLLVVVILSGLGTAAFHPQSAVFTARASSKRSGLGMSIFVTGGSAGHALGPIIIIPIVTMLGMHYSLLTMVFGIAVSALMLYSLPGLEHAPHRHTTTTVPQTKSRLWRHGTIIFLWFIVSARALIIMGFLNFLPIYLHNRSFSLFLAGASMTIFELSGSVGSLLGGSISDYYGRKPVIVYSLLLSLPFLYLFVQVHNIFAFFALAIAGLFIYSSIPVVILMAQELYPARINTVSSLMMGVSWGVGGLLMAPLGVFADRFGIRAAFLMLISIGVVASVAAMFLPESRKSVSI